MKLDEDMARLKVKEEHIGVQMATLSLKERELDACLVETREFSERLSQLVIQVVRGFLQQTQELSVIKFLLSAILFSSGQSPGPGGTYGPDVPPEGLDQEVPLPLPPAPQSSPVSWMPPLETPPPLLLLPGPYTFHQGIGR